MQSLFQPLRIQPVSKAWYEQKGLQVAVLRLDAIHPVISGNKWFKLKAYLAEAGQQGKKAILTFGGAYSNHILATAAASAQYGFASVGIIRGEKPQTLSPTLKDAQQYGMQLFFIARVDYKNKTIPAAVYARFNKEELYTVNEGGYGVPGMLGSMDILKSLDTQPFTYIIAAVGTGTMLSGLINAATPQQEVIGISVLKNNLSVESEIQQLLQEKPNNYTLQHEFHFGGYAKYTPELIGFMNTWYAETGVPTDFVYTAKAFYAVEHLIRNDYFTTGSSLLLIQSGGLQGNRSLPAGLLGY